MKYLNKKNSSLTKLVKSQEKKIKRLVLNKKSATGNLLCDNQIVFPCSTGTKVAHVQENFPRDAYLAGVRKLPVYQ